MTRTILSLPYGRRRHADPVPGAPAFDAETLSAGYPGTSTLALREVSLRVPPGSRVALVGPNGSGKSTLLKTAAGLLPVRGGRVRIYGNPPGACHHRVAYLPQRTEVDWRFPIDVRRLVLAGRYVHLGWLRRPDPDDWAMVDAALEQLGLSALAGRQVGQLSGGQQQRALLARALVQGADLLLLDEPLNAVDATTRAIVAETLAVAHAAGKTAVVATHDLGRLETDFDGAIYLSEGHEVPPPPGGFVGLQVGREPAWTA